MRARILHAADVPTLAFAAALAAVAALGAGRIPQWRHVLAVCAAIGTGLFALAWLRARLDWRVLRFAHDWSLAPLVYLLYRELAFVVGPIWNGRLFDAWLIRADRWLFGADPTLWIMRWASPPLTETLQIAYTAFYVLLLVVGAELYRKADRRRFHDWVFFCAFGFYLSYACYFALPAIGPRFTLHDYRDLDRALPGLWLTPALRAFVNGGGMVPSGATNAAAAAQALRDAFPSGHTMMTLGAIAWAWRDRLRSRWIVSAIGGLLIVATLYLQYHYVVDLVAGAALAAVALRFSPAVSRMVNARLGAR